MSIKVSKKETYTPAEMIVEWIEEDIITSSGDGNGNLDMGDGGETDFNPEAQSVTLK